MPSLQIWLHGEHVGTLDADRRGRMKLSYLPEVVRRFGEGTPLLSVALPASSKAAAHNATSAWIEGLLPEGESRTVLERLFGIKRGDSFALLSQIGRDCAGAVVFLTANEDRPAIGQAISLSDEEIRSAIESLPQHPLGIDADVRVSLGGLQAKLLLVRTRNSWARPEGGLPSTHILKPEPPQYPGLVAAEAYAQLVATLAGLDAAKADPVHFGDRPVLVVERFDREEIDGRLTRIHQEDACQALGLEPEKKYQNQNGPGSYRAIAEVLRIHAEDPERELLNLGKVMTFTVAIGNTDAHLRNHALLHRSGTVRLAPIYDAAPTVEFVSTKQVALWVHEQPMLSAITQAHLVAEMVSWGVSRVTANDVVPSTLKAVQVALPTAAKTIQALPGGLVDKAIRRVGHLLTN